MFGRMIRRRLLTTTLTCALFGAALPHAALARATTQEDVLAASVLTGWQTEGGTHMAGLQLTLAPGWKTYWRSPGDAGIPPQFDWSGSKNLKSVRLHWPSPSVFHTNGYQTIGYIGGMVLPIEVEAKDPSRPVTLSAVMELGICDKVCMPATLHLSAELAPPGAADPAIREALGAAPVTARAAGVTAVSCAVEPLPDGLRITATIAMPAQPGTETVAFETADPRVWVAESITTRQGGTLTASTDLVAPSGAPFALDRSDLTLTVIHARGSVQIDGCPSP
jgi:DsbC/DsbD-like thiol-disulfide interchange protein